MIFKEIPPPDNPVAYLYFGLEKRGPLCTLPAGVALFSGVKLLRIENRLLCKQRRSNCVFLDPVIRIKKYFSCPVMPERLVMPYNKNAPVYQEHFLRTGRDSNPRPPP